MEARRVRCWVWTGRREAMRWSRVVRTVVCVYTRVRSLPNVAARAGRLALEGGGEGRKVREGLMEAASVAS